MRACSEKWLFNAIHLYYRDVYDNLVYKIDILNFGFIFAQFGSKLSPVGHLAYLRLFDFWAQIRYFRAQKSNNRPLNENETFKKKSQTQIHRFWCAEHAEHIRICQIQLSCTFLCSPFSISLIMQGGLLGSILTQIERKWNRSSKY